MILVTGGTGLLGSRLLFDLTSRGERVRAIKRETSNLDAVRRIFSYHSDRPAELLFRIEWVDADIMDIDSLLEAMDNVNYVYHTAGFVSFDPEDREIIIKTNVDGTRNVVNACLARSVKKLCHVSSTSALGPADPDGLVREASLWVSEKDTCSYYISKYRSEMEVWKGMEEGLKSVVVNPSIILGPGFWQKGFSQIFPAVYRGYSYYTSGGSGFVAVEDVAAAMITLMNSRITGERFILTAENLTYNEVLTLIARSLKVRPPSIEINSFIGNIALCIDNLRGIFGGKRILTREILASAYKKIYLSNEKFTETFHADFMSIKNAINKICELFRKDIEEGWLSKKGKIWKNPEKIRGY